MMTRSRSIPGPFVLLLCALACVFPHRGMAAGQASEPTGQIQRSSFGSEAQAATAPAGARMADPYAREVAKRGDLVIISRKLADAVKKDNGIVLSKVAVKVRLDGKGELRAYELVQVDKGSVVEKMGFRPGDLITAVNNIRARDFDDKRQSLESSDRFNVTFLRKGKTGRLIGGNTIGGVQFLILNFEIFNWAPSALAVNSKLIIQNSKLYFSPVEGIFRVVQDELFMEMCLELAAGAAGADEVPVGAVIVSPAGKIVGRAHNLTIHRNSPLAHAEMLAIAKLRRLWRITGSRTAPCSCRKSRVSCVPGRSRRRG